MNKQIWSSKIVENRIFRLSNSGFSDNGFSDNGFSDNGFSDSGFSDSGFSDNGFSDSGFSDNGFSDSGLSDNGFSDNGFSEHQNIRTSEYQNVPQFCYVAARLVLYCKNFKIYIWHISVLEKLNQP